jgi:hypothetical protein
MQPQPHEGPINCRAASNVTNAPDTFMYMPGGVHTINASKEDKACRVSVRIDPDTANTLNATLARLNAERAPHRVWFDFDHKDDGPASGWPVRFFWRDGPQAGVYCEVEWSDEGQRLIAGKGYRGFSPSFYVSPSPEQTSPDKPGVVSGLAWVAGGLVNSPAFRRNAPLWSSDYTQYIGPGRRLILRGYTGQCCVEAVEGDTAKVRDRFGEVHLITLARIEEIKLD